MIYLAAFLTLCFLGVLALMLTAPEGWQDRDGFHVGRPTLDQLRRDLPMPCRSCGIGPCVCGEFDTLPALPIERRLDAREGEGEPDARPFVAVSEPPHSAIDTPEGQEHRA